MGKLNINNGGIDTNKVMPDIDERFGPYASIEAANTALGASGRDCITAGLTVGITQGGGSVKEYWYQPQGSGLALVPKQRLSGAPVAGDFASFDANGDLVDSGHKHSDYATAAQGTKADTAYQKPSGGIPATDLASAVQTSLGKADTAVQEVTVGTTTTGAAGTNASVNNSGTSTSPVLNFTIPRGADGQNAVNPFKGWYNAVITGEAGSKVITSETQNLPANPIVGDYAYVKTLDISGTAPEQVETPIAKIYECATAGTWSDSGRTADTSNVQTFASGQEVNDVGIDDTNLSDAVSSDETNSPILPKASDIQLLKQQLRGVTLQESKASFTMAAGYINESGVVTGSTANAHAIVTLISGFNKLRFVGLDVHANASSTLKKYSYAFYDANNSLISGSVKTYDLSTIQDADALAKEYIIDIPTNASKFMCSIAASNRPIFYCYIQIGESVSELIERQGAELDERLVEVEDKFTHLSVYSVSMDNLPDDFIDSDDIFINSSGIWARSSSMTSKRIKVYPGDKIRVTRRSINDYIAILTIDDSATGRAAFSTAEGFTDRFPSSSITGPEYGSSGVFTVPDDGAFFYYVSKNSSGTTIDTEFEILQDYEAQGVDDIVREYDTLLYILGKGVYIRGNTSGSYYPGKPMSSQIWAATDFVDVSNCRKIRFIGYTFNQDLSVGYAFYNAKSTQQSSVVAAYLFPYDLSIDATVNTTIEIDVPEGAKYFRTSFYKDENLLSNLVIEKPSELSEFVTSHSSDESFDWETITHLKPDNVGQLNAVKRMRKQTDIEWIPAFDIARGSTAGGRSFYNNKFLAGRKYKGIPYARADKTKYGYTDANTKGSGSNGSNFKVGLRIDLETFMTAVCNRGTVMEIESAYSYGSHQASFYANICAGGVSAALHIDYLTSANFGATTPPSGFTHIGVVNDPNFSLKSLKLGDVLVNPTEHTAMVTDVIIKNDEVVFVEVGENTTQGNGNYTIEGYEFGGLARRLWWNASDFIRVWGTYKVRRYNNIENVPYVPSPYVPMPNENYGYARYTMAVLPYMGNNFKYMLVDGVVPEGCRKLIVEEPSTGVVDANGDTTGTPVVFWNKKVNGEWVAQTPIEIDYTSYDANSHPYVYVPLPSDIGVGEYEAYISIKYDDSTMRNSTKCYWQVVDSLPLLDDY